MENKRDYEEKIATNLKEWQFMIDEIKSNADRVHPRDLLEFERQLDLLYAKHNLALDKLHQLQNTDSDVEWEELKASLDGISNEIENAIDSAGAKLG